MTVVQSELIGWIYDFSDYQKMYDLTEDDFKKRILDFPGMISSFNALATQKGANVLSASPLFEKTSSEMASYTEEWLQKNIAALKAHPSRLQDSGDKTFQEVIDLWSKSAAIFSKDYEGGKKAGRYLPIDYKKLPFTSRQFDLAICSHLLFQPTLPEGVTAVGLLEMLCDVAEEVRLYPLLDADGKITDDLGPLMLDLQQKNYGVEVREVSYQYRKGGNAMLRIWAQSCVVE